MKVWAAFKRKKTKQMDASSLVVVKNYIRLRGEERPRTDKNLALLQVFVFLEALVNRDHKLFIFPAEQTLKDAIEKFSYEIITDRDGDVSVKFFHPGTENVIRVINEGALGEILRNWENIFMQFMEKHECKEETCDSCSIKKCKGLFEKPAQFITSIQERDVEGVSSFDSLSLSLGERIGQESTTLGSKVPAQQAESSSKKEPGITSSEEVASSCHSSSDNSKVHRYRAYKNDCLKQYNDHQDFLDSNYDEIHSQFEKATHELKGKPTCILTYRKTGQKEIEYKFFLQEQGALEWAYDTIRSIEKHFVCIRAVDDTDSPVMVHDLKVISTKMIRPFTNDRVLEGKSFFDSGADAASFPYDEEKMEQMIHSATEINGRMEPIVYGELEVGGQPLPKIYEICMQNGGTCSIGIPQLQDMGESRANGIIHKMRDIINSKRKQKEKVIHRL